MEVNHEIQLTSRTFDGFIKKPGFFRNANGVYLQMVFGKNSS